MVIRDGQTSFFGNFIKKKKKVYQKRWSKGSVGGRQKTVKSRVLKIFPFLRCVVSSSSTIVAIQQGVNQTVAPVFSNRYVLAFAPP